MCAVEYYSHHEFRLKNVIITNFTIIVIKRKLLIRSNSLIINTVRSCEDPALVDEGGSANVEVLWLLQDRRLNKTLVSRSMKMNLIRVMLSVGGRSKDVELRTHMPGPLRHLRFAFLPRVETFPATFCATWCRKDPNLAFVFPLTQEDQ